MKRLMALALAACLSSFSPELLAQQQATPNEARDTNEQASQQVLITDDHVSGATIVDRAGKEIGTVSQITMGKDGKRVHLLTKVGDTLGLGGSKVAIPFHALQLRPSDEGEKSAWLTLDLTAEELKHVPKIETDQALELSDAGWLKQNADSFKVDYTPSEVDADQKAVFVDDLIGEEIDGNTAEEIAELKAIVFGLGDSTAKFAVLSYGGTLGLAKDYVAIAFSEVAIVVEQDDGEEEVRMSIPYDQEQLKQLQEVSPDGYPELRLQSVRKRIEQSKQPEEVRAERR